MKYTTQTAVNTPKALWREFTRHSKSFSFATRLLPTSVQYPIAVLYYYCRWVDTLADERAFEVGKHVALAELAQIEQQLIQTLNHQPPDDFFWNELHKIHQQFTLNEGAMLELIEGARWDLNERPIQNEADLMHYCNLVGGCVGVMMLPFLVKNPNDVKALASTARALGNAFQLTNILRDVGEDLKVLNRIYLPQSLLQQYGVSIGFLSDGKIPWGYKDLIEHLMEKAESLYQYSFGGIHKLHFQARLGITIAARIYREVQNEIRQNAYDNLNKRAYVSTVRKIYLTSQNPYYKRKMQLIKKKA